MNGTVVYIVFNRLFRNLSLGHDWLEVEIKKIFRILFRNYGGFIKRA